MNRKLGLIHLYTGEGKGKTTAALGLALRAAGRGIPVVILQFLKGRPTGELAALERLPGVTVLRGAQGLGFASSMTPDQRERCKGRHDKMLRQGLAAAREGRCGLLILDEVTGALSHRLLEESPLRAYLRDPVPGVELVLTGRDPPEWLLDRADYVTEMKKIRHPYDKGIAAREGVEY